MSGTADISGGRLTLGLGVGAHFGGPPRITVDGDEAVAVGHSLMVVNGEDGFRIRRATANRWELRRGPDGWRVTHRIARVLDGRPESPALLADGARAPR